MNLTLIQELLKLEKEKGITFVAVSKYIDVEKIREMHSLGVTSLGESRSEEFHEKYLALKDLPGLKWHFIGHLQRNKAEKIINEIDVLHSLDSLKLAKLIQEKRESPLDIYVELKLVDNPKKNGVSEKDLPSFLEQLKTYDKIHVLGFMAMNDEETTDQEKEKLFEKAYQLANRYGYHNLSMGMSDDYLLAIKHHATAIRIGRKLYSREECKPEYQKYYDE